MGALVTPLLLAGVSALMLTLNVVVLYNSRPVKQTTDLSLEAVNTSESQMEVPFPIPIPDDTVMAGMENQTNLNERYVTIGISSVWRNESYIIKTINSLINESTPEQRAKEIYIFLLLADEDHDIRAMRAENLSEKYSNEVASGFIRILQPPDFLYPNINFTALRRTYGDPVSRVKWRTKQVLDFTFLFWYTWIEQPSQYYLIMEDDVVCAKNYLQAIKDFVHQHRVHRWTTLQFADFTGIGRLLQVSDLDRLVPFLLMFYKEHPWDLLVAWWGQMLMAPDPPPKPLKTRRVPGIFQHIGAKSTLELKNEKNRKTVIDKSFRKDPLLRKPIQAVKIQEKPLLPVGS